MPSEKNIGLAAVMLATVPLEGAPRVIPEWALMIVAHVLDDCDAQCSVLRGLLQKLEWSANIGQNSYGCGICDAEQGGDHYAGCRLAAVLRATSARKDP